MQNEPTDSFICRKRLLLSQLKHSIQLNKICGLLNIKIRDNIKTCQSWSRNVSLWCSIITDKPRDEKSVSNANRCSFCRIKGHTIEPCYKKKNRDERQTNEWQNQNSSGNEPRQSQQQNFGCGATIVYGSNCSTCYTNSKDSPQYLQFKAISLTVIGHALPTARGAKTSVASLELKEIFTENKCVFQEVRAEVTLADGSVTIGKALSTNCDKWLEIECGK